METIIYILAGIGFLTVAFFVYLAVELCYQYWKGRKVVKNIMDYEDCSFIHDEDIN